MESQPRQKIIYSQGDSKSISDYDNFDIGTPALTKIYDNIKINHNYSKYSNFVHFSSAFSRLTIAYTKIMQILNLNKIIGTIDNKRSHDREKIHKKIQNIIKTFDGFQNYLYFELNAPQPINEQHSILPYPKNEYQPYKPLDADTIQVIK